MEEIVYNPQKNRLETIQIEYTDENTTWLDDYESSDDIYMITDYNEGIVIKEWDYSYPVWVYDVSRAVINNDQEKAKEIRAQCLEEYK